jgi:DNA polymerase II small subunit
VADLTDRGCLLDPHAAAHIAKQPDPQTYLARLVGGLTEMPFILTMDQLLSLEGSMPTGVQVDPAPLLDSMPRPASYAAPMLPMPALAPVSATAPRALAAEHEAEVRVLRDASGNQASSGEARDFVRYFNDRLETLTKLLKQRREVANAVRLKDMARAGRDVQLIGMVKEKNKTPNGYRFVTIEDATGEAEIMVPLDKPEMHGTFDSLLNDEVIGVVGRPSKDGSLLIAEAILRPDIPYQTERARPEGNLYVGFLGDVHVGSKTFLSKPFRQFVRWAKGDQGPERSQRIAKSMKYLVFPGDLVDGVGVYPGQQDALEIEDVFEQYRQVTKELADLPEHIHFVILPGNHDASRPTEPQPALGKDIKTLFDRHKVTFVSNPSAFSLHGVSILAYHGFSMVDFATSVPGFRMDQPIPIMKQMLQMRHIAPTYGGKTPILPEERDALIIHEIPDVFVTGHVHVAALEKYKGVSLVNGGTWQDQTDYQRMHNLVPTPARLPVLNLSTLQGTMIDFGVHDT